MTGACIIDGIDIATMGVIILRGGDHGFITFPTRKEPVTIEWPDRDGFEIADDEPVFEAKKLTVKYYLKGDATTFKPRIEAFADLHFAPGNRIVYIREFGLLFSLRFLSISSFKVLRGLSLAGSNSALIDVDYVMDDPTHFFDPLVTVPTALRIPDTQVTINTVDLADFGIIVKDVYSTAYRLTPKEGIVYNSRYSNGQTVTYLTALKKEKQPLTIACAMINDDMVPFMVNWNALWNALAVNSLTVGLTAAGKTYTGYFSNMGNFTKRPWTVRAYAEFELNFVVYENI